jgi:glycosyltransferase involved in cell wall biosynthesis
MNMTTTLNQEHLTATAISAQPIVTIVVVPRERFSYSRQSLESIYAETDYPFELVYVDGGSSPELKAYLETQSREKQFNLIRTEYYLSPNRARNLGIQAANGKYIVFVDNDVLVQRGWLQKLVECAEETGATVVGTLTCIDSPVHEVVHNGGGETHIEVRTEHGKTERYAVQKSYLEGKRVSKIPEQLTRVRCEFVLWCVRLSLTSMASWTKTCSVLASTLTSAFVQRRLGVLSTANARVSSPI